jgi:hypothetical protein
MASMTIINSMNFDSYFRTYLSCRQSRLLYLINHLPFSIPKMTTLKELEDVVGMFHARLGEGYRG